MVGESYVVRIYRRDPQDPKQVTGVVESAQAEQRQGFHSVAELLGALGLGRAPPSTDGRRKKRK